MRETGYIPIHWDLDNQYSLHDCQQDMEVPGYNWNLESDDYNPTKLDKI